MLFGIAPVDGCVWTVTDAASETAGLTNVLEAVAADAAPAAVAEEAEAAAEAAEAPDAAEVAFVLLEILPWLLHDEEDEDMGALEAEDASVCC